MRHCLLVLFLSLLAPCFAHSVEEDGDRYMVTHEWNHEGLKWSCSLSIPMDIYQYYQGRAHQSDDMVKFVLSDYDRGYVRSLVDSFREGGEKAGYSDRDNMLNVISFVQSLQYVSDQESKGALDYVRFPIETLVDGVGDCEDLSILAASILHEMGYGVLLVNLPEHLALAVECDDCDGVYYSYEGGQYFYLEVTNPGWSIGQIPDEYRDSRMKLSPLTYRPAMHLKRSSFEHDTYYSTDREVPFAIQCDLENAGPGKTEGLTVHIQFKTIYGVMLVDREFTIDDLSEGGTATYEFRVRVPRPVSGTLEVRTEGVNFDTDLLKFEDIELK